MAEQIKTRITAAQYLQMEETTRPVELLEGELIMSPPPIPLHQRLIGLLYLLLVNLIPDGEVFFSPIGVYLDEDNIPEPDIVWVAAESRCKIGEKLLEGPPDLIVEVLSPGTAKRDRETKYQLYQRFGVREYWVVDPVGATLEVYGLAEGRYQRQGAYEEGDSFDSAALGKTVTLKGVFA
jgi:Uma2 family endonuclease